MDLWCQSICTYLTGLLPLPCKHLCIRGMDGKERTPSLLGVVFIKHVPPETISAFAQRVAVHGAKVKKLRTQVEAKVQSVVLVIHQLDDLVIQSLTSGVLLRLVLDRGGIRGWLM